MYTDVEQWLNIRHSILVEGISRKQVVRETGISMNTVRKMLRHAQPVSYPVRPTTHPKLGPFISTIQGWLRQTRAAGHKQSKRDIYEHIRARGFSGSYGTVRNYITSLRHDDCKIWEAAYDQTRSLDRRAAVRLLMQVAKRKRPQESCSTPTRPGNTRRSQQNELGSRAFSWMRKVLQKKIRDEALRHELGHVPELDLLLDSLYVGGLCERNRCLTVLATLRGWNADAICTFIGIDKRIYHNYLKAFEEGGVAALLARRAAPNRKLDNERLKNLIFATLHEPPLDHGINRTTWTMGALSQVLSKKGQPACRDTIRKITHQAGWRWRKARNVLTSTDPDYAEKLQAIHSTLAHLKPDEAFFSIDEFGPFAVRMKGGRALTPPGEHRVIPQVQKSRGTLIMTAALELSTNQITHFYSEKKNTAEMIRMAEALIAAYPTYQKLFLSWDAASWHTSKRMNDWLAKHNSTTHTRGVPLLATVPLPSSAQFLNVIEAVFSGMARAVIHNSNYQDTDEAKAAIDRYVDERNAQFRVCPDRAGDKIWGYENQAAVFSAANNCKDPAYR
jgi:transposase